MSLVLPPQPSCVETWRKAVDLVDCQPGHESHNVVLTIEAPTTGAQLGDKRVAVVEDFLGSHGKSLRTIANTIFPQSLYQRYGSPTFIDAFHKRVLPSVRKNKKWSGYYFERMTHWPGAPLNNPLLDIVNRMGDPRVRSNNKFELALFDPARDSSRAPYGGQCLSFLSFKLLEGTPKKVSLTAFYRNHYYIEKLLGNFIGLGQLMAFVASETGLAVGPLTIISSHATIDLPRVKGCSSTRAELSSLLEKYDQVELAMANENSTNTTAA